ncbi:uncharacterized protein BP5553_06209 [Venustampulla echinocandica]|uniref:Transglycosylase SLT domain-containing protein n=1 Tax=Venustampulla echinocandica TaxID=2656787 RepID=A0A370TMX2_9HELO|nr:uncharacterized protein BP5553_06209 [Venustampulla echinocandica]RDL36857.1 hypothetical protein BP5553_06209 [Venustampulla echinocandica]
MAITSAFLILLSLSSLSLGVPVAFDDGQYHPEYDNSIGNGNQIVQPTAVAEVTSAAAEVTSTRSRASRTSTSSVPTATATASTGGGGFTGSGGPAAYTLFRGDGTQASGWPTISQWLSFEQMFANNKPIMAASCAPAAENNSEEEITAIKQAILSESASTGVDPRFILATIMEESTGCVRVRTTTSPDGIINPGLMQDHEGTASCFGKAAPCPPETISLMIAEGTTGTNGGAGLKGTLAQAVGMGAKDATAVYVAARIYNSGSYPGGDLAASAATACYASDIANLLVGFAGATSPCKTGAAGTL